MNAKIHGQVIFLLATLCTGMAVIAIYDMLRFVRWIITHGKISVWIEDVLFWCIMSIPVFYVFYIFNDGSLRWYGILMLIVGAWVYERGISVPVRKVLVHYCGNHKPHIIKKIKYRIKRIKHR